MTLRQHEIVSDLCPPGNDSQCLISLIQALQTDVPPDYDGSDAATWSAVSALSEKSVADRSRPMDFPDFTKGKWKTNPPVKIMGV